MAPIVPINSVHKITAYSPNHQNFSLNIRIDVDDLLRLKKKSEN